MTTTKSTSNTPSAEAAAASTSAPAPVAAKTRRPRKTDSVDQTVAKHQQALAVALEKAEAISYDPPQAPKAAKAAKSAKPVSAGKARAEKAEKAEKVEKLEKAEKPVKARKPRLVRDSYAMPETEYAQIPALKKRLAGLGSEVKKSELLRAGIAVLSGLGDAELQAVLARVERIKTGRPAKK